MIAAPPPAYARAALGASMLQLGAFAAVAAQVESAHSGRAHTNGTPPVPALEWVRQCALRAGGVHWHENWLAALHDPAPPDAPLARLAHAFGLSAHEVLALALALAVEEAPHAGIALSAIQSSGRTLGPTRPTLGLVCSLLDGEPVAALLAGPAFDSGMLLAAPESAPIVEQTLRIPPWLCLALAGLDGVPAASRIGHHTPIALPDSLHAEAERNARALTRPGAPPLLIRGGPLEARAAAEAVAHALGKRPLFVQGGVAAPGLAALLLLRGLVPVFCYDAGLGERAALPEVPYYTGPILAICVAEGTIVAADAGAATLIWRMPVPARDERAALWRAALGGSEPDPASDPTADATRGSTDDPAIELAATLRAGSERIAILGRLAQAHARTEGRIVPTVADVRHVARLGAEATLDALAQPIPDDVGDEVLVLPDPLRADLELLYRRCRYRDALVYGMGPASTVRATPGVRALLIGPSGTGKTLAAGWLATRLGLPLYRVDLAAVTSKYIGETEKNLSELLGCAERAGVVLLFDEADAMFARRTDIHDAHDRHANAQTNFLLQRIESYDGIALLTSNSRQRFDSAFARRLDAILDFPLPGVDERRALWMAHLGDAHALGAGEIARLAAAADIAGGHIRGAVRTAAVLARGAQRAILYADCVRGIALEYAKLGRQPPAGL